MKINCFKGPSKGPSKVLDPVKFSWPTSVPTQNEKVIWKVCKCLATLFTQCYNNWQQSLSCSQNKHFTKAKKEKNTQLKMTALHFTTTSSAKQSHMVEDEGYTRGM